MRTLQNHLKSEKRSNTISAAARFCLTSNRIVLDSFAQFHRSTVLNNPCSVVNGRIPILDCHEGGNPSCSRGSCSQHSD